MKVKLIVAMDKDRGIGKNNDLMWHLPADMKFFKEATTGHIVVLGRKNWDSIPAKFRPLPNRENVVLTRNKDFNEDEAVVFHSLEEALSHYKNEVDRIVFIIGGGQIYRQSLDLNIVDEMYITHVNHSFDADTFFPEIDSNEWKEITIQTQEKDEKNPYSFVVKHYTKSE